MIFTGERKIIMTQIIGYGLLAFAGHAMFHAGLWFDQWEYWAILLGFIFGESLIHWRN
jgi:hypothetical protein